MGTEGFVAPLLGALQASISVLLTICYGVAAQRVQLMRKESIDDMAGLGVKLFLPALIVVHLGEQLSSGNVLNYVPVLIWSILYTSISIGLAHLISRGFKLPPWVTPTCAFNNTTSLPLLLLQSLESVGSLELLILDGDTVQNAISRAQSYFLVCAVVSKTMGYAVGPKMLEIQNSTEERGRRLDRDPTPRLDQGEAEAQHRPSTTAANEEQDRVNEETTLLVQPVRKTCCTVRDWILQCGRRINSIVPTRMWVPFESPFADVMVLCTVVGVVLGVVPPLHRAFFNDSNDGGIFNAWLTSSIKNIGKLFTTLQIFIVGGKLGLSFEQMRSGSGRIPLRAIITIFVFRLILWPAISISLIYVLARSTGILQNDPILWFSMMLMPAGPPALVISSLAELAKIPESEEIEIAKSLTIMYALSPFACFAITGALKASEAALKARGL